MRKIDQEKSRLFDKAAKTINFQKIVLEKLEERAKKENTTVSNMVNRFCKTVVMKDEEFYREMAKYHYLKFQEFNYRKDEVMIQVEVKDESKKQ